MATSVSDESRKCLASLRLICTAASNDCDSHPRLLYHEQLRDTLERFVLWSGNIGALHPACSSLSLETRLHEAHDVLIFILDLLKGLNEAIEERESSMSLFKTLGLTLSSLRDRYKWM